MNESIGHNSEPVEAFAKEQLRSIIERVERVEAEIKDLGEGRKDIYLEAKSSGYDVPALKAIIARRRKDQEKLANHEMLVDTYEAALG